MDTTNNLSHTIRRLLNPALFAAVAVPATAFAGPIGEEVVRGTATIERPDGTTTLINQGSDRAVINWQSFSVGGQEFVVFNQPNASSVILNRVIGNNASEILGSIEANGRVFLVNPNGIFFGAGAELNVGSLLASTLDINDDDFMEGNFVFARNGENEGVVSNAGNIQVADGGFVVLAGDYVDNTGVIAARLGHVILAAGDHVTLDMDGDGLISFAVNEATLASLAGVRNSGEILADGSMVIMTANVARDLLSTAVNNEGLIAAHSVAEQNGVIYLNGIGGHVENSGALLADAATGSGVDGGVIALHSTHDIVHSGTISVDGENRGGIAELIASNSLRVTDESSISAQGPVQGGFVEVSGHGHLELRGDITIGNGGELLIDPDTLTIVPGTGLPGGNTTDSTIGVGFLEGQLDAGTHVRLVATQLITADPTVTSVTSTGTGELRISIGTPSQVIDQTGVNPPGPITDPDCLDFGVCTWADNTEFHGVTLGWGGSILLGHVDFNLANSLIITAPGGELEIGNITLTGGVVQMGTTGLNVAFRSVRTGAITTTQTMPSPANPLVTTLAGVQIHVHGSSDGPATIEIAGPVSTGLFFASLDAGELAPSGATLDIGNVTAQRILIQAYSEDETFPLAVSTGDLTLLEPDPDYVADNEVFLDANPDALSITVAIAAPRLSGGGSASATLGNLTTLDGGAVLVDFSAGTSGSLTLGDVDSTGRVDISSSHDINTGLLKVSASDIALLDVRSYDGNIQMGGLDITGSEVRAKAYADYGDVTVTGDITVASTDLTPDWNYLELFANGATTVGGDTAVTGVWLTANFQGSTVATGNITADDSIVLDAWGGITTGHLAADYIDVYSAGGAITTGNLSADAIFGYAGGGDLTTGAVMTNSGYLLSEFDVVAGDISIHSPDDPATLYAVSHGGSVTIGSASILAQDLDLWLIAYDGDVTVNGNVAITGPGPGFNHYVNVYATGHVALNGDWSHNMVDGYTSTSFEGASMSAGNIVVDGYLYLISTGDASVGNLSAWSLYAYSGGLFQAGTITGVFSSFGESYISIDGDDVSLTGITLADPLGTSGTGWAYVSVGANGGVGAGNLTVTGNINLGLGDTYFDGWGQTVDIGTVSADEVWVGAWGSVTVGTLNTRSGSLWSDGDAQIGTLNLQNPDGDVWFDGYAAGTFGLGTVNAQGHGGVNVFLVADQIAVTGNISVTATTVPINETRFGDAFDGTEWWDIDYHRQGDFGDAQVELLADTSVSVGGNITVSGMDAGLEIEAVSIAIGNVNVTATGGTVVETAEHTNFGGQFTTGLDIQNGGGGTVGLYGSGNVTTGALTVNGAGVAGIWIEGGTVQTGAINMTSSTATIGVLDTRQSPNPVDYVLADAILNIAATGSATVNGNVSVNVPGSVHLGVGATVDGGVSISAGNNITDTLPPILVDLFDDDEPLLFPFGFNDGYYGASIPDAPMGDGGQSVGASTFTLAPTAIHANSALFVAGGDILLGSSTVGTTATLGTVAGYGDARVGALTRNDPASLPNIVFDAQGAVNLGTLDTGGWAQFRTDSLTLGALTGPNAVSVQPAASSTIVQWRPHTAAAMNQASMQQLLNVTDTNIGAWAVFGGAGFGNINFGTGITSTESRLALVSNASVFGTGVVSAPVLWLSGTAGANFGLGVDADFVGLVGGGVFQVNSAARTADFALRFGTGPVGSVAVNAGGNILVQSGNVTSLNVLAEGDINLQNATLTATGVLQFNAGDDILVSGASLQGATLRLIAGGGVLNAAPATLSANALLIAAVGDIMLGQSALDIGNGSFVDVVGDEDVVTFLNENGLLAAGTLPSGTLVSGGTLIVGQIDFGGDYLFLQADDIQLGTFSAPTTDYVVQLVPWTDTNTIGLEQTAAPASDTGFTVDDDLDLFAGATVVIGASAHNGDVTVGTDGALDLGTTNLIIATNGTVTGLDTVLTSGLVGTVLDGLVGGTPPPPEERPRIPTTDEIDPNIDRPEEVRTETTQDDEDDEDERLDESGAPEDPESRGSLRTHDTSDGGLVCEG